MKSSGRIREASGFTLIELLVSMTVLAVMLLTATQLISTLRGTIARTTTGIQEFRDARTSFESVTRRLSQATLNAYDDLDPTKQDASKATYVRASELRFISGDADTLMGTADTRHPSHPTHAVFFQAPLGFTTPPTTSTSTSSGSTPDYSSLTKLLNTCGYFIEWDSDKDLRPAFLPSSIPYRYRYRLMELIEPSQSLSIYNFTSGPADNTTPRQSKSWKYTGREWFQTQLAVAVDANPPRPVHPVAENVALLALLPMVAAKDAKSPAGGEVDGTSTDIVQTKYLYDSAVLSGTVPETRNQLPPQVQVTMIALDEQGFLRYQAGRGSSASTDPGIDLLLSNSDANQKILINPDYKSRTDDLAKVIGALNSRRIGYRVFSAAIPLTPN